MGRAPEKIHTEKRSSELAPGSCGEQAGWAWGHTLEEELRLHQLAVLPGAPAWATRGESPQAEGPSGLSGLGEVCFHCHRPGKHTRFLVPPTPPPRPRPGHSEGDSASGVPFDAAGDQRMEKWLPRKHCEGCPFGVGQMAGKKGRVFSLRADPGPGPQLTLALAQSCGSACTPGREELAPKADLPRPASESRGLAWSKISLRSSLWVLPPGFWEVSVLREGHQVLREKPKQIQHKS